MMYHWGKKKKKKSLAVGRKGEGTKGKKEKEEGKEGNRRDGLEFVSCIPPVLLIPIC